MLSEEPGTVLPDEPPAVLKDAAAYEQSLAAGAAVGGDFEVYAPEASPAPSTEVGESEPPVQAGVMLPELDLNGVASPAPVVEELGKFELDLGPNEVVETAPEPEIELTAARAAAEVDTSEVLPDLAPTVLQDSIPVEIEPDAALVTDPTELAQFITRFGVEHPEEIPVGIAAESEAAEEATAPADETLAVEEKPGSELASAPLEIAPTPPEVVEEVAALAAEQAAAAVPQSDIPLEEAAPAPVVEAATEPETAIAEPETQAAPAVEEPFAAEATAETAVVPDTWQDFSEAAETQEAPPAEVAPVPVIESHPSPRAGERAGHPPAVDEAMIAEVVNRVIDQLKPELIAAIARQLAGK